MVNNLADDGDVLVKRKKFVGGRSVHCDSQGRRKHSGWSGFGRTTFKE